MATYYRWRKSTVQYTAVKQTEQEYAFSFDDNSVYITNNMPPIVSGYFDASKGTRYYLNQTQMSIAARSYVTEGAGDIYCYQSLGA